jgi:hypothetical protein
MNPRIEAVIGNGKRLDSVVDNEYVYSPAPI